MVSWLSSLFFSTLHVRWGQLRPVFEQCVLFRMIIHRHLSGALRRSYVKAGFPNLYIDFPAVPIVICICGSSVWLNRWHFGDYVARLRPPVQHAWSLDPSMGAFLPHRLSGWSLTQVASLLSFPCIVLGFYFWRLQEQASYFSCSLV